MRRLVAVLALGLAVPLGAETISQNLRRSIIAVAGPLYVNVSGDTMTGKLRAIDGTEAAPSIDSAAGAGLFFTSTALGITSGGETTTICGIGCAAGSSGTYGWSSTADATGTADLKLTRVGAKQLGIAGSTAGSLTLDVSTFTVARLWEFRTDVADHFVGEATVQAVSGKSLSLTTNTITGTVAEFNAALTDGDLATGGGTATGTNTGDQTSIVGITGTIAEFNTAVTDANLLTDGGALGTPSSGVATNITGNAAGLTAGTVTTNANLTGAIISVGNATSIGAIPAGSGSETYKPCGIIEVNTASAATIADTLETDLWTYSLPANTLSADGQLLRVRVFGLTASNANVKTIKLYWGAVAYTINGITAAPIGLQWFSDALFIRTGASAQIRNKWGVIGTVPELSTVNSVLAADTTAAITIKVTGQNGTANAGDITFSGAVVEFCP